MIFETMMIDRIRSYPLIASRILAPAPPGEPAHSRSSFLEDEEVIGGNRAGPGSPLARTEERPAVPVHEGGEQQRHRATVCQIGP